MAARLITTTATALAKVPEYSSRPETANQAEVDRCLKAASELLEKWCGRNFLSAEYTALHSGDRARRVPDDDGFRGARIFLEDPVARRLILPVSAVSSVTEDGAALAVYRMSTAPAFVDGEAVLVSDATGVVTRVSISGGKPTPKAWAAGTANIRVVCTAGFKADAEPLMPEDLIEACVQLTWLLVNEGSRSGMDQLAEAGVTASYGRLLIPVVKDAINRYRYPACPRTVEA